MIEARDATTERVSEWISKILAWLSNGDMTTDEIAGRIFAETQGWKLPDQIVAELYDAAGLGGDDAMRRAAIRERCMLLVGNIADERRVPRR